MSTLERRITIEGEPVAKGRPRFICTPDGKVRTYTDEKTSAAELVVLRHYQSQNPGEGPLNGKLAVWISFYEGKRSPAKQQDADNLAKLVMDALNGHAWDDDVQVWKLDITVWRDEPDPHTTVIIREIADL